MVVLSEVTSLKRSNLVLTLLRAKSVAQMNVVEIVFCVMGGRRSAESHATQPKLCHLGLTQNGTSVRHKNGYVKKGRGTVTMTPSVRETSYVPMKCAHLQDSYQMALTLIAVVKDQPRWLLLLLIWLKFFLTHI